MPLRPGIGGIKRTPTKLIQGVNGIKTEVTEYWSSDGGVKKLVYQSIKGIPIGEIPVGSILKLNENGNPTEYIVVHQGKPSDIYDNSCEGTWILRKHLSENKVWADNNKNDLESSDIHRYLSDSWETRYDSEIRNAIKNVKIPYRKGPGLSGSDLNGDQGLQCRAFLLSAYEVGFTNSDENNLAYDGSKLSYFYSGTTSSANGRRIGLFNGSPSRWWLRTAATNTSFGAFNIYIDGSISYNGPSNSYGIRPALVIDRSALVSDENFIIG